MAGKRGNDGSQDLLQGEQEMVPSGSSGDDRRPRGSGGDTRRRPRTSSGDDR